jgi:hypothetical protein
MTDSDARLMNAPVEITELAFEGPYPARGACDPDDPGVLMERDARAVVPAVFETPQAVDQEGDGLPASNVAYDSAHIFFSPFRQRKSFAR